LGAGGHLVETLKFGDPLARTVRDGPQRGAARGRRLLRCGHANTGGKYREKRQAAHTQSLALARGGASPSISSCSAALICPASHPIRTPSSSASAQRLSISWMFWFRTLIFSRQDTGLPSDCRHTGGAFGVRA